MGKTAFLLGAWLAAGAAAAPPQQAWIAAGESIAVVQTREWQFDWEANQQVFMRPGRRALKIDLEACIADGLRTSAPGTPVIGGERLAAALFPDLPAKQAPTSPDSIRLLLGHPSVEPRLGALNLRYLVYAGGRSEIRELAESVGCAGGFGAGLCIGFGEWTATASASLMVLDLKRSRELRAEGERTGKGSYVYLLPLAGFGRGAHAEDELCAAIGGELVKLLRDSAQ